MESLQPDRWNIVPDEPAQPPQAPKRFRINPWIISTGILSVMLLFIVLMPDRTPAEPGIPPPPIVEATPTPVVEETPPPTPSPDPVGTRRVFTGTLMTGRQLGEVKQFCENGTYLVADEGNDLVGNTSMLLLRIPAESNGTKMFSGAGLVGAQVEVTGKYPAQEAFCAALMCDCEDYILVESVRNLSSGVPSRTLPR